MMFCNVVSLQLFWSRKLRRNITVTFFMSIIVNIGMWFERFVIIVTSTYRDFLPSSWVLITVPLSGKSVSISLLSVVLYLLLPVCEILPGYCHCRDQINPENNR